MSAIFFRVAGYPTRLVSGFQGGEYNDFGDYWIIRDNDAHMGRVLSERSRMERFDPTSFVSPDLSLVVFLCKHSKVFLDDNGKRSPFIQKYYRLKLILDNFNYRWNLFIESFDRSFQKKLLVI